MPQQGSPAEKLLLEKTDLVKNAMMRRMLWLEKTFGLKFNKKH